MLEELKFSDRFALYFRHSRRRSRLCGGGLGGQNRHALLDASGECEGGSYGRQADRRCAGGVSISSPDQATSARTHGAEPGSADRLSGSQTAQVFRASRPDRPSGQLAQDARRSPRRHRRRDGLGQQSISGSILRCSDDGRHPTDCERQAVAGADYVHDQSRRCVGTSGQRRVRRARPRHQIAA